jgi:hypothetical protein
MKSLVRITIAAIFALTSSITAQEKLNLRLNLAPGGSTYTCTMDMNQTNTQTVDGEEQRLEMQMLLVWDYDVIGKGDDANTEINLTYKRVKIFQDYGHEAAEYDSDNPPNYLDPSMKGMATLPGTKLLIRMKSDGRVTDIQGIDEMLDKMIAAMALPDTPQRDMMVANLRQQFGAEGIKQSLEQITAFYPPKPVSTGESWQNSITMVSGFPMEIKSTYTLKSRENKRAIIDVVSDVSSNPQKTMAMGPLTMAYDIKGSQNGQIIVDEVSGLPTRSDLKLQFSGTVRVSGVPDEEPQSWPLSASSNVVVSFERKPE